MGSNTFGGWEKPQPMGSHTLVLPDWQFARLQELAKKADRSVSFITRAIFDRILPSLIDPSDIDSLDTRVNRDGTSVDPEGGR